MTKPGSCLGMTDASPTIMNEEEHQQHNLKIEDDDGTEGPCHRELIQGVGGSERMVRVSVSQVVLEEKPSSSQPLLVESDLRRMKEPAAAAVTVYEEELNQEELTRQEEADEAGVEQTLQDFAEVNDSVSSTVGVAEAAARVLPTELTQGNPFSAIVTAVEQGPTRTASSLAIDRATKRNKDDAENNTSPTVVVTPMKKFRAVRKLFQKRPTDHQGETKNKLGRWKPFTTRKKQSTSPLQVGVEDKVEDGSCPLSAEEQEEGFPEAKGVVQVFVRRTGRQPIPANNRIEQSVKSSTNDSEQVSADGDIVQKKRANVKPENAVEKEPLLATSQRFLCSSCLPESAQDLQEAVLLEEDLEEKAPTAKKAVKQENLLKDEEEVVSKEAVNVPSSGASDLQSSGDEESTKNDGIVLMEKHDAILDKDKAYGDAVRSSGLLIPNNPAGGVNGESLHDNVDDPEGTRPLSAEPALVSTVKSSQGTPEQSVPAEKEAAPKEAPELFVAVEKEPLVLKDTSEPVLSLKESAESLEMRGVPFFNIKEILEFAPAPVPALAEFSDTESSSDSYSIQDNLAEEDIIEKEPILEVEDAEEDNPDVDYADSVCEIMRVGSLHIFGDEFKALFSAKKRSKLMEGDPIMPSK